MRSRILYLVFFIAVCLCAGIIGSRFLPGPWYEALEKPPWNPPAYVFAPVWTFLYITMGIAAWIVWTWGGRSERILPLAVFMAQLVLNALWSYLFFGIHSPGLALIDIVVMLALICVTLSLFWRVRPAAGILLIPYLLWVGFASVLNFQLWRLNL